MSLLLVKGGVKVYLAGSDGMNDERIDRLTDQFSGEIEAALDKALDDLRDSLIRQFPKGLLTIRTEVE